MPDTTLSSRFGSHEQGIALVIAAVACFASLDTLTKFLSTAAPVTMLVWFRYLFQAGSTAAVLWPRRGRTLLHTRHLGLQIARGMLLVFSSVTTFFSLKLMPVGEVTAIMMLAPLLITLLAAVSLGEPVSPLRWLFVFGGFLGAMAVVRPGADDVGWALCLPLAMVTGIVGFQVLTGRLAKTEDPSTTHFYTGCVGVGLSSLALPFTWQALDSWLHWTLLLLLGVLSTLGHFLLILAYGRAPAASLTPFLYFQIAFATFAGWLVFSHAPDHWALTGILVIAACGIAGTWLSAQERYRAASLTESASSDA